MWRGLSGFCLVARSQAPGWQCAQQEAAWEWVGCDANKDEVSLGRQSETFKRGASAIRPYGFLVCRSGVSRVGLGVPGGQEEAKLTPKPMGLKCLYKALKLPKTPGKPRKPS